MRVWLKSRRGRKVQLMWTMHAYIYISIYLYIEWLGLLWNTGAKKH